MSREAVSATLWEKLVTGGDAETLQTTPNYATKVNSKHGLVRLAIGPGGEFKLLLPIGVYDRLPVLPTSPALSISAQDYRDHGQLLRYLEVTNRVAELNSVFAEVSDAILQRIDSGSRCIDALTAVLAEFRALLIPENVREATRERIVGLVGELLVLERLFQLGLTAVEVWSGWDKTRHDFASGNLALEVKSTTRPGSSDVHISSMEQLVPPKNGELCLAHLILEPVENGEESLGGVFSRLAQICPDVMTLRNQIASVGCADPFSASWNRYLFRPAIWAAYSVQPGFPSVIPEQFLHGVLPAGVNRISYNLDLACAAEFQINDRELESFMKRLGGVV